eukprot:31215-Pelagococcus_subviridis.AAC.8
MMRSTGTRSPSERTATAANPSASSSSSPAASTARSSTSGRGRSANGSRVPDSRADVIVFTQLGPVAPPPTVDVPPSTTPAASSSSPSPSSFPRRRRFLVFSAAFPPRLRPSRLVPPRDNSPIKNAPASRSKNESPTVECRCAQTNSRGGGASEAGASSSPPPPPPPPSPPQSAPTISIAMPPFPTSSARLARRSASHSPVTSSTSRTVRVTDAATSPRHASGTTGAAPTQTNNWSYRSVVSSSPSPSPSPSRLASLSSPLVGGARFSFSVSVRAAGSIPVTTPRATRMFSYASALSIGRSTTFTTDRRRVTRSTSRTAFTASVAATRTTSSSGARRQSSSAAHAPATPAPTTTRATRAADPGASTRR